MLKECPAHIPTLSFQGRSDSPPWAGSTPGQGGLICDLGCSDGHHHALIKVNIFYVKSWSLTDAAAYSCQEPNEQLAPQVCRCILKLLCLFYLEVGPHFRQLRMSFRFELCPVRLPRFGSPKSRLSSGEFLWLTPLMSDEPRGQYSQVAQIAIYGLS